MKSIRKMVSYGGICLFVLIGIVSIVSVVRDFTFYNHDLIYKSLSSDQYSVSNSLPFFVGFFTVMGWVFSIWMQKSMRRDLRQGILAIVAIFLVLGSLGFLSFWLDTVDFKIYPGLHLLSRMIFPSFVSGSFLGSATFLYGHFQKAQNKLAK